MGFYFLRHFIFSKRAGNLVRSIALLCILGVFVSVFATIIVVSIMLGFNDAIYKRTLALQPHFEILQKDLTKEQRAEQQQQVFGDLSTKFPMQVYSSESQDLLLRTVDGLFSGVQATGVEVGEWQWIWKQIKDKNNISGDFELAAGEIAVGVDLARELAIYEGDEVVLIPPDQVVSMGLEQPVYEKVKVARVLRTDVPEIDAKSIFYDSFLSLHRFRKLDGVHHFLSLRLDNNSHFDQVATKLEGEKIPFTTWKDKNRALLFALNMEKMAMGGFLFFTVMIASFSIFTVLSLLISQKKKDIGVLLTLGYSPSQVSRIFTQMGLLLSGVGSILGAIAAVATAFILKNYDILNLPADIYYDHQVPIRMDMILVLIVVGVSLILSFLGSWIPARWSADENVIDLLRDRTASS
jgi:lipoprotein-releasing system permease protein